MDSLKALIVIFIALIIAIFCGLIFLEITYDNSIPKGCAEVPVPDTCHTEMRPMMVGKIVSMQPVEVCTEVIACYNGTVFT